MKHTITNAVIYTGEQVLKNKNIVIEDETIVALTADYPSNTIIIDLQGKNIAPGFIDIQINGGEEHYFSKEMNEIGFLDIYTTLNKYATPYCLPTIISSTGENILKAIEEAKKYKAKNNNFIGIHLEGPFINPERNGAHSKKIIRKPENAELKQIIEAGKDVIKVMTIAPECFTDEQLEMLLESGIVISAGHTTMTYDEAQRNFGKGIHLVTHLYNAMTQMGHRECGTVGAVLDNDTVFAPIILDGGHCHYASARIAARQKKDKLFLVSDATFIGRKKKDFKWKDFDIKLVDGYYRDAFGNLAGSAISMPEAVKNAAEHLDISLQEAVEMATSRPAKAIGLADKIGYIKKGYPAKLVVFDDALESIKML